MQKYIDFKYDYTKLIKQEFPLHVDERFDKLIKSYLYTHQFSEDILITREDLIDIIEYFLEENEYISENKDKILLILNKKNDIKKVIDFLKWILKILSINIIKTEIIQQNDIIILMINIENYENTFNGKRIKEIYL